MYNFPPLAEILGTSEFAEKHQCPFCGKVLSRMQTLKRHMEKHTGNRKCFKCHLCDHIFTWRDSLKLHIKRKHPESILRS